MPQLGGFPLEHAENSCPFPPIIVCVLVCFGSSWLFLHQKYAKVEIWSSTFDSINTCLVAKGRKQHPVQLPKRSAELSHATPRPERAPKCRGSSSKVCTERSARPAGVRVGMGSPNSIWMWAFFFHQGTAGFSPFYNLQGSISSTYF